MSPLSQTTSSTSFNVVWRAIAADIKGSSGACADPWEHREALGIFAEVDGVEPTSNHA